MVAHLELLTHLVQAKSLQAGDTCTHQSRTTINKLQKNLAEAANLANHFNLYSIVTTIFLIDSELLESEYPE